MKKDFSIPLKKNSGPILQGFTPVAWHIEIVRGCNLQCGFCATAKFPRGEFSYMTEINFTHTLKIIAKVSPETRIEFSNAGEQTLHPDFIKYIKIARNLLPKAQLGVVTNGTTLLSKQITYQQMFEAGLNVALVDVYGPIENHIKLAKESGYEWYEKSKPHRKKLPQAWTNNHNSKINIIILQPNPGEWPKQKNKKNFLSTFMNEIDWELGKKYGLRPITEAPQRRCDQPSKYANVCWDGEYVFCCFDFMRQSAKRSLGNVSSGLDGFIDFWLGRYMQKTRLILHNKDRNNHSLCSKCNFCSTRCDIPFWPEESLRQYIRNGRWNDL